MLSVVLALGGLWITLIVICGLGLFIMAGYAMWKMRSDDFWDQEP